MAWTTPKTDFAPGDVLTAAQMNAIGNNLEAIGGAWTAYTPTWTNLTVGNATQDTRYIKAGRLLIINLKIVLGSTSSVGTIPQFSLPSDLDGSYDASTVLGPVSLKDNSAGSSYFGRIFAASSLNAGRVFADGVSGTSISPVIVSATVPFTWANGDMISGTLLYETAS